jgi:hypothetical protein
MCTGGQTDSHHEPNTRCKKICVVPDIVHSVIYSMERVLLKKLTGFLLVKKFPEMYGNPKVLYRSHKCPPPASILRHLDPVYAPTPHFLKAHLNSAPVLYRLLIFHVPNTMSHFRCTKMSVQVPGCFATQYVLTVRRF